MNHLIPIAALALAAPAIAATPDWNQAKRIEIDMANFKYTPDRITLRHGEAYVLQFVNRAKGGHDFVSKSFFAAAQVDPADSGKVADGEVELAGGERLSVRLTAPAAAATYPVHCSHFLHQAFGMKGAIVVQ